MRLSRIHLTAFLTVIASLTMGNFWFIPNFPALAQTPDTQLRETEALR